MRRPVSTRRTRNLARRRGAAAVEFAIILPLLILLVLGCVDFGRFAYTFIAVTNAARAGAEYASTTPVTLNSSASLTAWKTQVRQWVLLEMGGRFETDETTIAVNVVTPTTHPAPVWITVQVTHPFAMAVPWPLLPDTMSLSRTVQMRMIR
jgi:Flp pilus assembly protein TadG